MSTQAPDWNDDAALAAWVDDVIFGHAIEAELEHPWHTVPEVRWSEIVERAAREAVVAAGHGNFRPLADMLENGSLNLGLKMRAFIARRLRGEYKVPRGRPKQTIDQRHGNTPVHAAAAEVPTIERILRHGYPTQTGFRERAVAIAALRAEIKDSTLTNYLKSDRRLP